MTSKIFLNGIWKSGNNLVVKICEQMAFPYADFGLATSLIMGDHYLLRQLIRGAKFEKSPILVGLDIPVTISKTWLNKKLQGHNAFSFGGHCAYSDQLMASFKCHNVKPIHIIRDPRDVIVSFAHWILTRPDYYPYKYFKDLSLKDRMTAVIEGIDCGEFYIDGYAVVMDRAFGWLTNPDVLIVKFEDLVGLQGGGCNDRQILALESIANWIGFPSERSGLEEISEKIFGGTKTFRKGLIGEWKNEFDDELIELFNERIGIRLQLWGYE